MFIYKWICQHRAITRIADYISRVEHEFALGETFGWETLSIKSNKSSNQLKDHTTKIMVAIFLSNVVGAFVYILRTCL